MVYEKDFEKAFPEVIGIEGGYVNDPDDPGKETKFGISKRSYPNEDIKNLTLERAKEIYYFDFWSYKKLNIHKLEIYDIKLEVFDSAVNLGQYKAGKIFQESLNILNLNQLDYPDILVDGWIGSETLKNYRKVRKYNFLKTLNGFQFMHYVEISKKNKTFEKYFNGWLKRVWFEK